MRGDEERGGVEDGRGEEERGGDGEMRGEEERGGDEERRGGQEGRGRGVDEREEQRSRVSTSDSCSDISSEGIIHKSRTFDLFIRYILFFVDIIPPISTNSRGHRRGGGRGRARGGGASGASSASSRGGRGRGGACQNCYKLMRNVVYIVFV